MQPQQKSKQAQPRHQESTKRSSIPASYGDGGDDDNDVCGGDDDGDAVLYYSLQPNHFPTY